MKIFVDFCAVPFAKLSLIFVLDFSVKIFNVDIYSLYIILTSQIRFFIAHKKKDSTHSTDIKKNSKD